MVLDDATVCLPVSFVCFVSQTSISRIKSVSVRFFFFLVVCIQLYRPHSERGHLNSYLFLIDRRMKGGFDWVIAVEVEAAAGGGISAKFSSAAPSSIFLERNARRGSFAKWRRRSGGQSGDESADVLSRFQPRVGARGRVKWKYDVRFTRISFVCFCRVLIRVVVNRRLDCDPDLQQQQYEGSRSALWKVMI